MGRDMRCWSRTPPQVCVHCAEDGVDSAEPCPRLEVAAPQASEQQPRPGRNFPPILLAVAIFGVIDAVVELALAGIVALLAGTLFLRGRPGGSITLGTRTLRQPQLWASVLALVVGFRPADEH
jgi:hypothetical protein